MDPTAFILLLLLAGAIAYDTALEAFNATALEAFDDTALEPFNDTAFYDTALNAVDRCWRRDPRWAENRQHLAMCSLGFAGKMTENTGEDLTYYVVTDDGDDLTNPRYGTLRYGATMLPGKVWITFDRDMTIILKQALVVKSFTAFDGRGADVHIAGCAGFLLYEVENVIVHGLHFHDIVLPKKVGPIVGPGGRMFNEASGDGDSIRVMGSRKVWIDHNTFAASHDGLIDVTLGSTDLTISNNWFRDHNKVMLLGHSDDYDRDTELRVTVALNRFGPNCNQRMPRVRYGYAHVVNNFYDGWKYYAVGGSMGPSIRSEANVYVAPSHASKEVTKRMGDGGTGVGSSWNWCSVNDAFENGAFFQEMGSGEASPGYTESQSFDAADSSAVRELTKDAGALRCHVGYRC